MVYYSLDRARANVRTRRGPGLALVKLNFNSHGSKSTHQTNRPLCMFALCPKNHDH
jgi:hypothetical protein